MYFRLLMVGHFEGIDSERGIAWRASDSLSIRSFVRIALESVPDHSTISRARRLVDVETHQAVFQSWLFHSAIRARRLRIGFPGARAPLMKPTTAVAWSQQSGQQKPLIQVEGFSSMSLLMLCHSGFPPADSSADAFAPSRDVALPCEI